MAKAKPRTTHGSTPLEDTPGPDLTGTITSFTAENPTIVTMDGEDTAMVEVSDVLQLEPLTGDPDAMAAIAGSCSVLSKNPIRLSIDLSAAIVEGLTADFLRDEGDVGPENGFNHGMASASPGTTTIWHPAPGVQGVPVEENPEDTAPGTASADEDVPDPDAPLTKRLSNAEALARYRAQHERPVVPRPFPPGP